jgi:L-amino acid N-acyltransferase YncA
LAATPIAEEWLHTTEPGLSASPACFLLRRWSISKGTNVEACASQVSLPSSLRLRPAVESDLAAIHEIYDEQVLHGTASFDTTPRTEAERLQWFHGWPRDRYPIIVAEKDGRVVGWGRLSPWSPRRAYDRTVENSVYVHRDFRGQGIGKLLLVELIRLGREAGLGVIIARITHENPGSIAMHKAHGFRDIGVMHRVGEKFGRLLDVHMLELHLDGWNEGA